MNPRVLAVVNELKKEPITTERAALVVLNIITKSEVLTDEVRIFAVAELIIGILVTLHRFGYDISKFQNAVDQINKELEESN